MSKSKRWMFSLIGTLILATLMAACLPITGPGTGNQPSPTAPPVVESPPLPTAPTTLAPTLPSGQSALVDTHWSLVSMGAPGSEAPAIADVNVTLDFGSDGRAVGSGGCNSYGSPYTVQNGVLSFDPVVSTKMACMAAGVMEQEQAYFQALESAGEFIQSGDQLIVEYNDGQGILNFARTGSLPTAIPTGTSVGQVLCAVSRAGSIPGWELCQSPQFGFEFQYPDQASLTNQTADTARIDLPITPGTNLNEKYLDVSVTQGAAACTSPLGEGYAPGTIPTENVELNGVAFLKETGQDAAAGSLYNWTAYSTEMNGVCASLGFVLHSHHPELDPTPPPEFDQAAESQIFSDIASTFRWLESGGGSSPSATPAASATATPIPTQQPTHTATPAVQPTPAPQRITFATGATSARISGDLPASGSDLYVIRAQAGQTMSVDLLFNQGRAILAVWGADGTVMMSDHAEASSFSGRLPSTQDYFILLKGRPDGQTVYQMEVRIPPTTANPTPPPTPEPQRISFRTGATSASVSGDLRETESDTYIIRALEGQTMNVDLSFSRGRAILVVWGEDGTVLLSDHAAARSFSGRLPSTQDYFIRVLGLPDRLTEYQMTVSIPPANVTPAPTPASTPAATPAPERISFRTGATSASVSGDLPASGSDLYVLRALSGQTMNVDLSFTQGRAILAVWGADGTVLMSDHAEASSFSGRLPSTQDYFILLKGRPDGRTSYTLVVSIPPR